MSRILQLVTAVPLLVVAVACQNPPKEPEPPSPPPSELPAKEQFAAVFEQYPAVTAWVNDAQVTLEMITALDIELLDLAPDLIQIEGLEERLQESVRVSQCLSLGGGVCLRCEIEETECRCGPELNEFQRALCERTCEATRRLVNCRPA